MSRRFDGRHYRATARPDAKPQPPEELTDENSTRDTFFPDIRYANQLNTRAYVKATSAEKPKPVKPARPADPPAT